MTNKFSKSISDRKQQEAVHLKNTILPPDVRTDPSASSGKSPDAVSVQIQPGQPPICLGDLSRRRAKGKTFYLDDDLIAAIKLSSESSGIAESRIVNGILRRAFGL